VCVHCEGHKKRTVVKAKDAGCCRKVILAALGSISSFAVYLARFSAVLLASVAFLPVTSALSARSCANFPSYWTQNQQTGNAVCFSVAFLHDIAKLVHFLLFLFAEHMWQLSCKYGSRKFVYKQSYLVGGEANL
jgi:hypothetical protein